MTTYFVYIDNPRNPNKVRDILSDLKAKEYSKSSWIFESDSPIQSLFRDLAINVGKRGFTFIIDVSRPQEEMYWPTEARHELLRPHSDLDKTVAQFLGEIENDD